MESRVESGVESGAKSNDNPSPGSSFGERVLSWDGPAAGVNRLELRGGNGSATVRAIDGDKIRIRLGLKRGRHSSGDLWRAPFRWFFRSEYESVEDLKQAIELQVEQRGSRLVVKPLPHGRSRESRIAESWQIEIPRHLGVAIVMDSAEVEVRDLEGGVDVSLGHGAAEVDVPSGPLDLEVTVGKIDARVRDGQIGKLSLSSQVGDTRLWLDGDRVRYPRPPGPGSEVEIDGDGKNDVRVHVRVGDASLRVR